MSDLKTEQVEAGGEDRPSPAADDIHDNRTARYFGQSEVSAASQHADYVYHRLLAAGDFVSIVVAAALGTLVTTFVNPTFAVANMAVIVGLMIPVWFVIAYGAGQYHEVDRRISYTYADELVSVVVTTVIWCWFFVLLRSFVVAGGTAMLAPALMWLFMIPLVLFVRALVRGYAKRQEWNRRPVAVIGDSEGVEALTERIERNPEWGLQVKMIVDFNDNREILVRTNGGGSMEPGGELSIAEEPVDWGDRSRGRALAARLAEEDVSRAIIAGGSRDLESRTKLIHELIERGIAVDQVSGGPETLYSNAVFHDLEGLPVLSIRRTSPRPAAERMKRLIDVTVSGAGLILLSPVLLWTAIRIKLDSKGPVLYRQERCGLHGEGFELIKFRSMVDGAHQMRPALRGETIDSGNDDVLFKLEDDPRTTPYGDVLRRTSIDELPQLWNVFKGDMSMVGPRPLVFEEALQATDIFSARTRMKPGIAGPWQSLGRNSIPFEDMIKLDYAYVVGWSMGQDLRLLLGTVTAVISGRGAQ